MNRPFELTVTHAKRFERFFGWPVLIIFLISFIVMLRTQATWVIPMYVNEDAFILIGGIVALWGLTKSYREKKWKERILGHQSRLPTYEEVLERREDVWNYHQK